MQAQIATLRQEITALGNTLTRGVGIDSPQFRAWLSGESISDPALAITALDAWKEPWVRKGVSVIARSLAWLPLQVVRRKAGGKDKTIIADHWLPKLLAQPNPFCSANAFWKFTVSHMLMFGECFWWGYDSIGSNDRPEELWIVDPRMMQPKYDYNYNPLWPVIAWEIMVRGQKIATIDPLDVAHFRYDENPFTPWRGSGPLESMALAVGGNIEASKYNVSFFRKGAKLAGVLQTDKQLMPDKADDIRRRFMTIHREPHQIAVLWGGMKFQSITESHKDMEFGAGKDKNREEILGALGVPPVVVGVMDGASYANAFQQTKLYWTVTMIPLAKQIAATLTGFFLKREPGLECEFSTDGIEELREEMEKKANVAKSLFSIGMPYNDILDLLDIRVPHQDWGDEGLIPFNLVVAADLVNPPEDVTPAATPAAPGTKPASEGDTSPEPTTVNAVEQWAQRTLAIVERAQRMLAPAIDVATVPEERRLTPPTRTITDQLIQDVLLIIEKDRDKLSTLSRIYYDRFFELGGIQAGDLLEVSFDVANYPAAIEFLATKEIKIKDISDTVREKVRDTLIDGITKGETTDELSDRVRAAYNFFTGYGAKRIARTEAASTVNGARNIVMRDEGVTEREWVTAHDERVRDSHQQEDGNTVVGEDTYPVTGLRYPGDPSGPPEEIINCRCLELPVFGDEERQARARLSATSRDVYSRAIIYQYGKSERDFARRLRRFFNDERAAVLKATAVIKFP